jgi:MFS superfamily sulfate permease-like transporter
VAIVKRVFPFLEWIPDLNLETLRADLIGGVTVALVLVPQSMAYAQLAGLPAYYGLYAAFLPPMVATLFGSSRQLATGPVAVVSLMTAQSLAPLATAGSQQYIAYAILLALIVGLFQFLLGLFRLGLIVNFLSHPVVNGFTNAAAIIIGTSQLSKIFGVHVDSAEHHYETVYRVLRAALTSTHLPTLGMAVLAFTVMIGLRRVNPRIPNVLVAVVLTTVLSLAFGYEQNTRVTIDSIASDNVRDEILEFNRLVGQREAVEKLRATGTQSTADLMKAEEEFCLRCHPTRTFTSPTVHPPEPSARELNESALLLHQIAGFLDHYLDELAHQTSVVRTELRTASLRRVEGDDGRTTFYPVDELPAAVEASAGRWRIKVGNGTLDTSSLLLVGGGDVVGAIPAGLPPFSLPTIDLGVASRLIVSAIIISILGFMEAISIAKAIAARTKQRLDPDQELIGQGLANMIGCLSQSYAVSGSFSRSAVNLQAGARTGMSNVFSSVVVAIVLLFFSGWLYHLPQAVLAAIIMMAVFGLLNVSGFIHAWHAQRFDGIVSLVAFVGTLAFAPHLEYGIFLAVALSVGGYLFRTMRPHIADMVPSADGTLTDASRHHLDTCRFISVVRFEGPLNFTNSASLEDEVLGRIADKTELRHLLIAAQGINEIDASGEDTLRQLVERLRETGLEVSFSGLNDNVIDVLKRTHLYERIGEDHMYPTQARALRDIYVATHAGGHEPDCPFRAAMPRVTELSLAPDGSLRDAGRHGLDRCRHIAIFRFDDALTFANATYLENEISQRLSERPQLRQVIFVAHSINEADPAGATRLLGLVTRLRKNKTEVSFSGFKDEVLDVLEGAGSDRIIGEDARFPTDLAAIAGIYAAAHEDSTETGCPLRSLAPTLTELSLHSDGALRDARAYRLPLCRHVAILRIDGPMVLANPAAVERQLMRWVRDRLEVTHILLVAHTLTGLDAADSRRLLRLVQGIDKAGFKVSFAGLRDHVFESLGRAGVADVVGIEHIFSDEDLALAAIYGEAHRRSDEEDCPLKPLLPVVSDLSLAPDGSLRDARSHGLELCRRIAVIRFDGPLNYATIGFFKEAVRARLSERPELRSLIFAMHGVQKIDALAAEELCAFVSGLGERGLVVGMSGVNDAVLDVLRHSCELESLCSGNLFPTQVRAIEAVWEIAHEGRKEEPCPLREVVKSPQSNDHH